MYNVINTLKHIREYITLKRQYNTRNMRIALFAGLITYRRVTDGPSLNPMDYMFSTKYTMNITTAYGFALYMKIHLKSMYSELEEITSMMVGSTYGLYQATMQGNDKKKADSLEVIIMLHKRIDTIIEKVPKDIEREVNKVAYKQMEASSLGKRSEMIMEKMKD